MPCQDSGWRTRSGHPIIYLPASPLQFPSNSRNLTESGIGLGDLDSTLPLEGCQFQVSWALPLLVGSEFFRVHCRRCLHPGEMHMGACPAPSVLGIEAPGG